MSDEQKRISRPLTDPRSVTSRSIRSVWGAMMGLPDPPPDPPLDRLPPGLVPFAAAKGSLGPLVRSLCQWGHMGLVPEREKKRAEISLVRARMGAAAMRAELGRVLSACAREGIDVVLFKGHDLINTCYHDDAIRPVTDADLLVKRDEYPKLTRVLLDAGYRAPEGEGTCVWSRGGLIVDVHFEFVSDVRNRMSVHLPRIPSVDIFKDALRREIGGAPYLSPDPGHSLIITALHALTHSYLMDYWFLDAGVLIIAGGGTSFVERCLATAEEYRLGSVVGLLFWAIDDLFAFPADHSLPGGYRPPAPVRWLIRAAAKSTRYLYFGDLLLGLSVDGRQKKMYYYKEMAFPRRDIIVREAGIEGGGAVRPYLVRSAYLVKSGIRILLRGGR
jgi:hypothetical protein